MQNFLYGLSVWVLAVALTGCQSLVENPRANSSGQIEAESDVDGQISGDEVEAQPIEGTPPPKVGLILGAGGVRAFAHVGVLKAFEASRIPIHSIAGLEWGALVGALYSAKGSVNDLEWQLFKMKEDDVYDVGLLGSSDDAQSTRRLRPFMEKTMGSLRFQDMKIPMSCPTKSLVTDAFFWLDQGPASSLTRMCMSFPPFFQPTQNRYAAVDSVTEAAEYLREGGAELIVFVNVLAAGPLFTRKSPQDAQKDMIIWSDLRKSYQRPTPLVDEVVGVYIKGIGVDDFEQRRAVIARGESAARELIRELVENYDF